MVVTNLYFKRWLFVTITVSILSVYFNSQAADKIKYTGTFSNLAYHEETGDLLGVELRIVYTRAGYKGILQIAEGGAGDLIIVSPIIKGDKISFTINHAPYNSVFNGTISNDDITGYFIYKNGVKSKEELPRKQSYWD